MEAKRIYRCTPSKKRHSINFISSGSGEELRTLLNLETESENLVEAIFQRPIPVSEAHQSRFLPVGFSSHAIYFSDSDIVPFVEFLFHYSTNAKSHAEIKLSLFIGDVSFKDADIKNVNRMKSKKKILSPTTYKHSHDFVRSLKKRPQIITYENVRHNDQSNNHAIYDKSLFLNFSESQKKISAKIEDKNTFRLITLMIDNSTIQLEIAKKEMD